VVKIVAGKVVKNGLPNLVGVVVSCHMGGSMMPKHDIAFGAPTVNGSRVVVNLFDFR
tara:strand:+ start:1076 stop:1246 length:171 start_codon:yes stop_codon:yes gene_type:complete